METRPPRTFFVHVMKTSGTTLYEHLKKVFPVASERYPAVERGPERVLQYMMVDELRKLSPDERRGFRLYCGHFPFAATTIVEPEATITLVRDPVDRTVSILRQFRRSTLENLPESLEELYEHPLIFPLYVHNYQAKQFAMTTDDKLDSHMDVIDVDAARLQIAKENLERVDVVGLTHLHDQFLDRLQQRFGWRFGQVPAAHVSTEGWDVGQSFRRRIAEDNPADMEFYEFALDLHARRRS